MMGEGIPTELPSPRSETFGDQDGTFGDQDETFGDQDETFGDQDGVYFLMLNPMRPRSISMLTTFTSTTSPTETTSRGFLT